MSDLSRAEAIKRIESIIIAHNRNVGTDTIGMCSIGIDKKDIESLIMAVNSLKVDEMYDLAEENADEFIPMSVIEDIKAEIAKSLSIECEDLSYDDGFNNATKRALRIIDKHIGKENE